MASGNFILGISAQITNLNDIQRQLDSSFKLHKQIEIPVKIKDGEYGVGTTITLPTATAQSDYFRYAPAVSVSVYKDGELLSDTKIHPKPGHRARLHKA